MKKRFLSLLAFFVLIMIGGAFLVISNIDKAINNLDNLVQRYQKERNCTKVLIAIKKVQQDGLLHHGYNSEARIKMNKNIAAMHKTVESCSSCHHPAAIIEKIQPFIQEAHLFHQALLNKFGDESDPQHKARDMETFAMGQHLYEYGHHLFTKSDKQLAQETMLVRNLTVKSRRLIFIIVWSGLVIMVIAAIVLLRSFTTPLQTLLTATAKIKQGDLNYRVIGLKYEFGELAAALNDMAISLQSQMRQLQRNEQLATCGRIATTLAHEVRNPLAGIKIAMEVLAGESTISKDDRQILLKVVEEVNLIKRLLSNMLEFARPKPPNLTNININETIEKALNFTPGVIKGETTIHWEKETQLPEIQADPEQLRQVLLNLFINAEAAMGTGGSIFITTDLKANNIILSIQDTGPGIAEENLLEIFQPFFSTKAKGSGLGLATCKTLIALHNGTIIASNSPDGGAIFTITLPINGGTNHGDQRPNICC